MGFQVAPGVGAQEHSAAHIYIGAALPPRREVHPAVIARIERQSHRAVD